MSDIFEIKEFPKPLDTQTALAEAEEKLRSLGGEHALIGGLALTFYGLERYTKDVDFIVSVETSGRAEAAWKEMDPQPLRLGGVSMMTSAGVRVDLIDRRFEYRSLFEEALKAALKSGPRVRVGSSHGASALIPIVPLPYLVALKLIADRPQDEADLKYLLALDALDYPAARDIVYRHVGPLPARWLDKMARAVGRIVARQDYDEPS